MYNKEILVGKIEDMFKELRIQSSEIIAIHSDATTASKMIVDAVSSETTIRSKTLLTDMYACLSEKTLSSPSFSDAERKSLFYGANIRGQILSKYQFDITTINAFQNGLKYKEFDQLYSSLAVAAGTAAIGGILKYVLVNAINIPIVVIIAGAVTAFCISFFKGIPLLNKTAFRKAIDEFLTETKNEFILWFDEIEGYYNKCIDKID
ncbi:hypothetical protein DRW41_03685 [Neobacillus piezotolerans]|uniref:Uncharacterized protein n=1 Tax=Neobacillus piezotolerans TaxID=2259171 RepID=A0A3D8GWC7_9BACI|nr:hypothetical protein [Neobacillus piezotolerans]RDU38672.1 hypothetical protein DRW41_03685 [Neobacillus piezotolerans]